MCAIERIAIKILKPLDEMLKKIAYFSYTSSIAPASIKPAFCLGGILLNTKKTGIDINFPREYFFRNNHLLPYHGKETISPNLVIHQTYF
jgi:hypothetical protein